MNNIKTYRLVVEYAGGLSSALDKKIRNLVGKSSAGSGYDLRTRIRDIEWYFRTAKAAVEAMDKIFDAQMEEDEPNLYTSIRLAPRNRYDSAKMKKVRRA